MAKFIYRAKNTSGDIVTGSVVSNNQVEAEDLLLKNNLILVDIEPEQVKFKLSLNRFGIKDKLMFTRQLSTLVGAGISLPKAIAIIANQATSEYVKSVYYSMVHDLEQGQSLSMSMSKFPTHFTPVMISVVRSGEQTGNLEEVLKQLADQLDRDSQLISKVRNAMIYPIVVIGMMIIITIVMLVFVVPKFKEIFAAAKADLPVATKMLIGVSDSIVNWWYFYLVAILFIVFAVRAFMISDYGSYFMDKIKIKIPLFSSTIKGVYMARLSQTLAMMNRSGVPILESIKIVATVMNNRVYENILNYAASQVERGIPLSSPLSKAPDIPQLVSQMVAVGEQTGQIETIMDKLGAFYEEETNEKVKGLSSLIEPLIIAILGIAVAFVVISIITPIYKIAQIQ